MRLNRYMSMSKYMYICIRISNYICLTVTKYMSTLDTNNKACYSLKLRVHHPYT